MSFYLVGVSRHVGVPLNPKYSERWVRADGMSRDTGCFPPDVKNGMRLCFWSTFETVWEQEFGAAAVELGGSNITVLRAWVLCSEPFALTSDSRALPDYVTLYEVESADLGPAPRDALQSLRRTEGWDVELQFLNAWSDAVASTPYGGILESLRHGENLPGFKVADVEIDPEADAAAPLLSAMAFLGLTRLLRIERQLTRLDLKPVFEQMDRRAMVRIAEMRLALTDVDRRILTHNVSETPGVADLWRRLDARLSLREQHERLISLCESMESHLVNVAHISQERASARTGTTILILTILGPAIGLFGALVAVNYQDRTLLANPLDALNRPSLWIAAAIGLALPLMTLALARVRANAKNRAPVDG